LPVGELSGLGARERRKAGLRVVETSVGFLSSEAALTTDEEVMRDADQRTPKYAPVALRHLHRSPLTLSRHHSVL